MAPKPNPLVSCGPVKAERVSEPPPPTWGERNFSVLLAAYVVVVTVAAIAVIGFRL